MGNRVLGGAFAAVVLSGITIKWTVFSSPLYPYTMSRPSSFTHQVVPTASGQQIDYFFPQLIGSFPTNVNISAEQGAVVQDEAAYLRQHSGHAVRQSGWVSVMGHRMRLIRAEFAGLTGKWIEEQISFTAKGYVWRLTASYEPRFKSLRPTMLRMLSSFKLR